MLVTGDGHWPRGSEASGRWIEQLGGAVDSLRRIAPRASAGDQDFAIPQERSRMACAVRFAHVACRREGAAYRVIKFRAGECIHVAVDAAADQYPPVREKSRRAVGALRDHSSSWRKPVGGRVV